MIAKRAFDAYVTKKTKIWQDVMARYPQVGHPSSFREGEKMDLQLVKQGEISCFLVANSLPA